MFDKKDAKELAKAIEELIDAKLRHNETRLPVHDDVIKHCRFSLELVCRSLITDED